MHMAGFLIQENIRRYRRLLDVVSNKTQRRQILNLLEEEECKERDLQRSGQRTGQLEAGQ
jgi:hypothetical protein